MGKLHLPNRIVMAPLTRNRAPERDSHADDGRVLRAARQRRPADHRSHRHQRPGPGLRRRAGPVRHRAARRLESGDRSRACAQGPHLRAALACRPGVACRPAARRAEAGGAVGHHGAHQDLSHQGRRGLVRSHFRAARAGRRGAAGHRARLPPRGTARRQHRGLRRRRSARRQRLPAGPVPQDRRQPPRRRLRRLDREPRAADARSDARGGRRSGRRAHRPAPLAGHPGQRHRRRESASPVRIPDEATGAAGPGLPAHHRGRHRRARARSPTGPSTTRPCATPTATPAARAPGWSTTATTRRWPSEALAQRRRPGRVRQALHRQPRPGAPAARRRAPESRRTRPRSTAAARTATPTTRPCTPPSCPASPGAAGGAAAAQRAPGRFHAEPTPMGAGAS